MDVLPKRLKEFSRGVINVINEIEGNKRVIKAWRVRLGNMYYVQGLARLIKDKSQEHYSYEFTTYKEAAWLFPLKLVAENIAESCGGVVEDMEMTFKEYSRLEALQGYYENESEAEWHREQEKARRLE